MASPLSGSLAKTIGKALASTFLPAVLTRTTTAPGPNPWEPGVETTVTYPCRAIHDQWGAGWLQGGLVASDEVKLIILAASLAVEPQPGDRITIRGETFTVVPAGSGKPAVSTDAARATWECRAKR